MKILYIGSDGICEMGWVNDHIMCMIDYGRESEIKEEGTKRIQGWGKFDGESKTEYRVEGCVWTFVLPGSKNLNDLVRLVKRWLDLR